MIFGSIYEVLINVTEMSAHLVFFLFTNVRQKRANYFMAAVTEITSLQK